MANYEWPFPLSLVSDEFGPRQSPGGIGSTNHRGMDFGAAGGSPIKAAKAGTVIWAGYNGGEGNSVHVRHDDGNVTKYFHARQLNVSIGQRVVQGDWLSFVGTTGASTGNHLHFETWGWVNGSLTVMNPRIFFDIMNAGGGSSPSNGGSSTPIETGDNMPDEATNGRQIHDIVRSLLVEDQKSGEPAIVKQIASAVEAKLADDVKSIKDDVNSHLKSFIDAATLQLKNVVTRERWQLFSVEGSAKLVAVNTTTGAYTVYPQGLADPQLAEDIAKEKVSSWIDGSGKRVPDNAYPFKSDVALENFIDGLRLINAPADV